MNEREWAITNLMAVDLSGGSHEMLSSIAKAVLPNSGAWTLRMCEHLRDRLVRLLGEVPSGPRPKGGEEPMAITDEVRRDIDACTQSGEMFDTVFIVKSALLCDLDRIDAAHEEAIQHEHETAYDKGYDAGFASADDWLAEHEDAMAEHGWYRVVDADKQTIRFNDDVEWELLGRGKTESGRVVGIKIDLIADRQNCRVKVVRDSDFQTIELMAKNLHHVKLAEPEPTVEDVLREMADSCYADEDEPRDRDAIVAEYAAKLQLRGDAE